MNKITVTFDRSQEDIPTMVVVREAYSYMRNQNEFYIENIITGDKACEIWDILTSKKED